MSKSSGTRIKIVCIAEYLVGRNRMKLGGAGVTESTALIQQCGSISTVLIVLRVAGRAIWASTINRRNNGWIFYFNLQSIRDDCYL